MIIKHFHIFTLFVFCFFQIGAQNLFPIHENGKWGFSNGEKIIINPTYDTVFPFDEKNKIALVATINEFNSSINPLTGEKEPGYDYFYINTNNKKFKLLPNDFPDSLEHLPFQQEFHLKYRDCKSILHILFQDKVYLFSIDGKQLTQGYDNIYFQEKVKGFLLENIIEKSGKEYVLKGLYNHESNSNIPCKYKTIEFNLTDSIYFCCSALFDNSKNDDVYNYKGKRVAYSPDHIEFASKNCLITKVYHPKTQFWVDDKKQNKNYSIEGDELIPLKNNHCLIISKNNYTLFDLNNHKRIKVNETEIYNIIFTLIEYSCFY